MRRMMWGADGSSARRRGNRRRIGWCMVSLQRVGAQRGNGHGWRGGRVRDGRPTVPAHASADLRVFLRLHFGGCRHLGECWDGRWALFLFVCVLLLCAPHASVAGDFLWCSGRGRVDCLGRHVVVICSATICAPGSKGSRWCIEVRGSQAREDRSRL